MTFSLKRLIYRIVRFTRRSSIYLSSAWMSILILLIIAVMLMFLEQGGTVFIDLLHNKNKGWFLGTLNLSSLFLYIFSFSLLLSHYPIYLFLKKRNLWTVGSRRNFEWKINKPTLFGYFGFITFAPKKDALNRRKPDVLDRTSYISLSETSWFRHNLGIINYSLMVYILAFTYQRFVNADSFLSPVLWSLGHWLLSNVLYAFLYEMRRKKKYRALYKLRAIGGYTGLLLSLWILIQSFITGWSEITFYSLVILLCSSTLFYAVFRISRSISRSEIQRFNTEEETLKILKLSKRAFFSFLDNDLTFLRAISLVGVYSITVIVVAHVSPFTFNPLIVLFAYLNVFYGIIIVSLKHYIYYTSRSAYRSPIPTYLRRTLTVISRAGIGVLFAFILFPYGLNDHHSLDILPAEASSERVNLDEFVSHFMKSNGGKEDIYFISSYGGGLKANYWNLLVLERLDSAGIIDQTFSMSGVSGGALGQSFFELIRNKENQKQIVEDLGESNFVTLDLAYLLGFDFLRTKIPFLQSSEDRAKKAMRLYADKIDNDECNVLPFRKVWKREFFRNETEGHFLPMLIENTAGTHHKRGIVSSVYIPQFDSIFPNGDDILTIGTNYQSTLSYMQGVSLANRFPLFSPAARIPGIGHFVDGGYFENSGLLSNVQLYKYLVSHKPELFVGKKVHFLQITNDPSEYTWLATRSYEKQIIRREKVRPEIMMILETGTSLQMLPRHVYAQFQLDIQHQNDSVDINFISLPYTITEKRISSVYGLESYDKSQFMEETISSSQNYINSILKEKMTGDGKYTEKEVRWKYIEPPLARALGTQVKRYMDLMATKDTVYAGVIPPKND